MSISQGSGHVIRCAFVNLTLVTDLSPNGPCRLVVFTRVGTDRSEHDVIRSFVVQESSGDRTYSVTHRLRKCLVVYRRDRCSTSHVGGIRFPVDDRRSSLSWGSRRGMDTGRRTRSVSVGTTGRPITETETRHDWWFTMRRGSELRVRTHPLNLELR